MLGGSGEVAVLGVMRGAGVQLKSCGLQRSQEALGEVAVLGLQYGAGGGLRS